MNVTLLQLTRAVPALQTISRLKLRPNPSFWLARVIQAVQGQLRTLEYRRIELVKEYGVEQTDQGWKVDPEDIEKSAQFDKELQELLDTEVELDVPQRPVSYLGEMVEIEPAVLGELLFLFTE